MLNIDELALAVIENLGGEGNILKLTEDKGRLRFRLRSPEEVREDSLRKLGGIKGILEADNDIYMRADGEIAEKLLKNIQSRLPSADTKGNKKSLFAKVRSIFKKGQ